MNEGVCLTFGSVFASEEASCICGADGTALAVAQKRARRQERTFMLRKLRRSDCWYWIDSVVQNIQGQGRGHL